MTSTDATHPAHFHAGSNDPGYLPDSEPACFPTFREAAEYMIDELRRDADAVASWADPHDCDDIPCPTYGDDCPESKASDLTLLAEELNLESGPSWDAIVNGRSYWITPADPGDCDEEEEEPEPLTNLTTNTGRPVMEGLRPRLTAAETADFFAGRPLGTTPEPARRPAPVSTRPVWNRSTRSLSDLTPADLHAYAGRKLAHNTYAETDPDGSVGVRFHSTRILTFHPDGSFTVNTGGYRTVTTKQRLNALLPAGYRVWQRAYVWHLDTPEGTFPFEDGDTWKLSPA